jgi:hypothetical protein
MASPDDEIRELLAEAAVLAELDVARAEAWASGLLAEWPDHDALLRGLESSGDPLALAIAVALAPMLPAAAGVAATLRGRGLPDPEFAPYVGTARPIAAWYIRDRHGQGTSIVVELEHADGTRHDMLAELDGATLLDLLVAPPGVVDGVAEEAGRRLTIDAVDPATASSRIRAALEDAPPDAPLTDAYLLNRALVASRVGVTSTPEVDGVASLRPLRPLRPPRAPDPEGDALARSTLAAALGPGSTAPAPRDAIAACAVALRRAAGDGDAELVQLAGEAGIDPDVVDDVTLLVRLAGAYVAPGPRAALSPAAADAVDALEWADWLGAVLPLVRDGRGADASPDQLVRNVNRCPEVTTSIPKRDAPAVASAFACALPVWRLAGCIDDELRLTDVGVWVLPRALAAAWGARPGELER